MAGRLRNVSEERLEEVVRRVIGPDWERQRIFIRNPVIRAFALAAGFDMTAIDNEYADAQRGLVTLLEAAVSFGPLGWAVSARNLRTTDYEAAAAIWRRDQDPEAVDALLGSAWTDLIWLRHACGPVTTLAGRHGPTQAIMRARLRLLDKAVSHHMAGDYEASTLIVLSQVDGLTFDFTNGEHGFFWHAKDTFFEDDHTLAGMPEFLRTVRAAVNARVEATTLSGGFRRHAFVHGRDPAFGTQANSAKAFALLAAVIDWLEPKATRLTERWQVELEGRYTGSTQRDANGRRLDQRGFPEARQALSRLSTRLATEYRTKGRYDGALPARILEGLTLSLAPDGQSYWAWAPTRSDVCLGVAARAGEFMSFYYADDGPPDALGADGRWRSELDDLPPDWES